MCTTVIVGKKASLDAKNIIARNEDSYKTINQKYFEFVKASEIENRIYKSILTNVEIKLPDKACSFTAIPDVTSDTYNDGRFSEASVNEYNVAISATESLYGNERVLAHDPLVENGIAEDAIVDIVIPYVKTARQGVLMLGELIEKYGSAEGNGVIFSDENEIWYMEIPTGHHYVAIKIPDDMYAIAPNCVCIEEVDLDDKENVISSKGIKEFVEKYRLNVYEDKFNFRKIFGTSTELDRIYNTPRAWFSHKYLDSSFEKSPTDNDIPFLHKADRLISIEDVQYILSSHYNETIYDPIGKGDEKSKTKFRAISLSRTQESHIIENDDFSVCWIAMATTAFTPYVPFFVDINDTPKEYKNTHYEFNLDDAYWLFKVFSYYVETNYSLFSKENAKYLEKMRAYSRRRVYEIKEKARTLEKEKVRAYLTEENEKTVQYILGETRKLLNNFMEKALEVSKMSFTMDKNL